MYLRGVGWDEGNRPESWGKPQMSGHLSQALKNEEEGGTSFQAKEAA